MPTAAGGGRFTTAIIERRRGREASAEEAMVEMHLAGAPARRTEEAGEVFVSTAKSTKADADENPTQNGKDWRSACTRGKSLGIETQDALGLKNVSIPKCS